jgi:hypothetical protein
VRCALLALLLVGQDLSPADEYAIRVKKAPAFAAGKLVSLGDWLADKDQHGFARVEFRRAVAADPDHEGAHKRLGERRGDTGWEIDPGLRLKVTNEKKKEEEFAKIRADYVKKVTEAERAIGLEWTAVGNLAEKAGMKAEAETAWRKAVEYAPGLESARKKLGHEKRANLWMTPEEKKIRDAVAGDRAKATSGAEDAGKSDVGTRMELTLVRQASEHFLIESSYLDKAALADLVQRAEHTWASFHAGFGCAPVWKNRPTIVILKDKAQHEKFVDLFHKGSDAEKAFTKKSAGWNAFPLLECQTGDKPAVNNQDYAIHYPAQAMARQLTGGRALWVVEGMALWFSDAIQDTAIWACVSLASTGTGDPNRNNRDPKNWPFLIKGWVADGKDPDIDALVKCSAWAEFDGAEAVKAWSLLDFLMCEHREKLSAFLADMKSQKDTGEASLAKVFGWTLAELDARWRTWARAAYAEAK